MARIGLVQTRGIGDIIIALPIAAEFARRGDAVLWPVDARFLEYLKPAAPFVDFIPVPPLQDQDPLDYLLHVPNAELRARRCDVIHVLYNALGKDEDARLQNIKYAQHLKFDEYKYAVTGVPFDEKWKLKIVRDPAREARLFESLGIRRPYVCVHRQGSKGAAQVALPAEWERDFQIVEVGERSASPFDWIATLERADKLVLIDSCFSNLVEQLNLPNEKYLILRTPGPFTPVLKNGWNFL
jgi:hypothetical protein